jgi:hypothetical protein
MTDSPWAVAAGHGLEARQLGLLGGLVTLRGQGELRREPVVRAVHGHGPVVLVGAVARLL